MKSQRALIAAGFLVTLSLLASGCASESSACDQATGTEQPGTAGSSSSPKPQTQDDIYAHIGTYAAGFAGFYYNDGVPTIAMVDPSDAAAVASAKQATRQGPGQGYDIASDDYIKVVKAKYSFVQLNQWYERVWTHVLEIPGAVSTDIDEVKNHLVFGDQTDDAESAINAYLKQSCLPDGSYEVKHEEPPVPI